MERDNLEEILRDFHTVSGMDISVVDADFHTLSLTHNSQTTLCSAIHRDPLSIDVCKASDIERLTAAREDARAVLYTCPFGITEAIVPIIRYDEPIGYIISALGIEQGGEDTVLASCEGCREVHKEQIRKSVSDARKFSREELGAYFNMMKMLADFISVNDMLGEGNKSIGQLTKRYIKNNLTRKLTLKDIARNLHCSTVTLTEHFKGEFGITINDYITEKRMQLSEKLLLTTEKPLREIAASAGFADVEYFSRTFKKHHGKSPASWRREKGE
jgi:AraC-like DNA-binding protein